MMPVISRGVLGQVHVLGVQVFGMLRAMLQVKLQGAGRVGCCTQSRV